MRNARRAQGLTLVQLGRRTGYSASQVSRYERGQTPLTDMTVLRRFAEALTIRPETLGLLPSRDARRHDRPTGLSTGTTAPAASRVSTSPRREDGEDPVQRRDLLTGLVGVAGTAALGRPDAHAATPDPTAGFDALLYGTTAAQPLPLPALRAATTRARDAFQAARYRPLAADLPALIAAATATRDHASGADYQHASTLLADAYSAASNLMVKLNDDTLAWATADRAHQAALHSQDVLALAEARRGVATVLRRIGRADRAHTLLLTAAEDIRPDRNASPAQVSMYGTLLQVAAYTAAVDGNRDHAHDLITEAAAVAARLGHDANHRHTAFGPTNVTLYQVSIAQVLGDNGTAIDHATTIRPADIPTPERRGRYWIDVARAYHQWGKHERCYHALLAAERAAPGKVRYRPPVHRMTLDLLHANHRLPGLRDFAHRIALPA